MAAVDVTISGVLYDKINRTTQPVVLIGEASLTGLGVGGGPIIPPGGGGGGGGGQPPGGGGQPPGHPSHPIWPGEHPEHPIELPPPGSKPPEPIAPPVSWKAVWHPTEGWIVVGVINPDIPHPVPS